MPSGGVPGTTPNFACSSRLRRCLRPCQIYDHAMKRWEVRCAFEADELLGLPAAPGPARLTGMSMQLAQGVLWDFKV